MVLISERAECTCAIVICIACGIRRMRWVGHVARMEDNTKCLEILIGKSEGYRSFGRRSVHEKIILKWNLRRM
jgi:hypothetical protein